MAWRRGLIGGTGGRRKLCMVPCHSCYINGTLRSKEWGGFKVITNLLFIKEVFFSVLHLLSLRKYFGIIFHNIMY